MSDTRLLADSFGRVMRDLRISVTDRCNFRCLYCLPETEAAENFYRGRFANAENSPKLARTWHPRSAMLSFEEIERLTRIAVANGIRKIRITGGEPLLRRDLPSLIAKLSAIPGVEDLAMTTNGFLFEEKASELRKAGLRRVTFSMDSLDRETFRKMTGREGLDSVLRSIRLAKELGFDPVKVNAVVIRGLNEDQVTALARFARDENIAFRFIEFMPLDSRHQWKKDLVVPAREILRNLREEFPLEAVASENRSETARRWRFPDGRGEIGLIAPVSEPFCGHCNRLRLTADGKIRTCLFSNEEHDVKALLRGGADDETVAGFLRELVWHKEAGHRIGQPDFVQPERTMSCIGG
jgi:cyclic pyranopterin phosphate synthase